MCLAHGTSCAITPMYLPGSCLYLNEYMLIPAGDLPINFMFSFNLTSLNLNPPLKKLPTAFATVATVLPPPRLIPPTELSKLVKPVALTLLPGEIKMIESTKKRKDFFIQIVLPLILKENNNIKIDRKRLFNIINKSNNSALEKKWLQKKYKQYGIPSKDLSILKIRMDEIPVSLAIAQAAKETGWGTSRFAQEGNALFGQWTWSGEGIKPAGADGDSKHKVAKFKVLKASVKAYQRNLNTHSGYKEFRRERAIQRDNEGKLNSLLLVNYLDKYAETGVEYTKVLKKIIEQNSLTEFDDVKILPTTKKLKNLI